MHLNSPLLMTNHEIFLSKHHIFYLPLATTFRCVNILKDVLIETRLGIETFNKNTKFLAIKISSLKHYSGCIGFTVQKEGMFALVLVSQDHKMVQKRIHDNPLSFRHVIIGLLSLVLWA